tara:strand:+ start:185 stop:301 length:117 start_codon:yes stop_codon:yes gene_type:complete
VLAIYKKYIKKESPENSGLSTMVELKPTKISTSRFINL